MQLKNILFYLFCGLALTAFNPLTAQLLNDECSTAINLTGLDNWCSNPAQYNNSGATDSGFDELCIPNADFHDVWFSFVAQANTANIRVIGQTGTTPGGTLSSPQFVLYEGDCTGLTELECASDNSASNIIEAFAGPLTIGQTYYLRIDGRNGNTGTFRLCINNYNEVPEPQQDCNNSVILCDKSPFTVQSVVGFGQQEIDPSTCMREEIASTWYSWTCDDPGTLAFTLTPNNPSDDLDFIVYELPNGVMDCSNKQLLRCMASGENVGEPFSNWEPCTGPTGLSLGSTDTQEDPGCQSGNDNFVAAIDMQVGTAYALVINNFSNTGNGFSVEFSGSGTFKGPEADFFIDPPDGVTCDEVEVAFIDGSSFEEGTITGWSWNFGSGAMPQTATTPGPHTVLYSSIGTKSISLVIETNEGCIVTKVLQIEVEECCQEPSDISLLLKDAIDPVCAGDSLGAIFLSGMGGTPFYEYSFDGGDFTGGSAFYNLPAGTYPVVIRDTKGCIDSIEVTLVDPPVLTVDAGEDVTIVLGGDTQLSGTVLPSGNIDSLVWSPPDSLSCIDCLNPGTDVTNQTTYTLTATDLAGCSASDEVTVFVEKIRPIYIPNAFSPNFDGTNDYFTLYGNVAAQSIVEFRVFNRWGAMVWEGRNLIPGHEPSGWDGMFRGEKMQPDVFAFYAIVRFIDGVEILYEGDVTLFR